MALRARRRACSAGSRSRNLVALIDWVAPVHMNAAMTSTHSVLTMSPPARPPEKNGIASSAIARTRPAQAAAMVAASGLPVIFQMTARSIRPPSSGRPGSRLNDAHDDVGHHRAA